MQPVSVTIVLVADRERAPVLDRDGAIVQTPGRDRYALKPCSAVSTGAVLGRADTGHSRQQSPEAG